MNTLSALIFEGLNFRVAKISRGLIREIWLNSRKFAKYKSREISRKLQTAKIAKLKYSKICQKKLLAKFAKINPAKFEKIVFREFRKLKHPSNDIQFHRGSKWRIFSKAK